MVGRGTWVVSGLHDCIVCFDFMCWMLLGGRGYFFSPRIISCNNSIEVISSIGAFFGWCLIAAYNCFAASRILYAGVNCGMAMAWCLNLTVSEILSLPVYVKIHRNERYFWKHGTKYHSFLESKPHVFLRLGLSWIIIYDPGGAMGVASKWYLPSIATHTDISGFCRHFLTILTQKLICGHSLHQYAIGNVGGSDVTTDFTHDFQVCSACYAGLMRCISRGVHCRSVCWLAIN